ncbi:hypothetical protein ACMHYB_55640 [Sorangium sp. So ce1128]
MSQETPILSINVDVATLSLVRHGPITGDIFIQYGDTPFPEARWSDFPAVILSWWCHAATRLTEASHREKFLFMDGSFCFDISKQQDGTWYVRCFDDVVPTKCPIIQGGFERLAFIESLMAAADSVARASAARAWKANDLVALSAALNTLRHSQFNN